MISRVESVTRLSDLLLKFVLNFSENYWTLFLFLSFNLKSVSIEVTLLRIRVIYFHTHTHTPTFVHYCWIFHRQRFFCIDSQWLDSLISNNVLHSTITQIENQNKPTRILYRQENLSKAILLRCSLITFVIDNRINTQF